MENIENYPSSQYSTDPTLKLRDIEDKLSLMKSRLILLGQSYVEERDKNLSQILELKKSLIIVQEENKRIIEHLKRITEQLGNSARKEELLILEKQFNLFRK